MHLGALQCCTDSAVKPGTDCFNQQRYDLISVCTPELGSQKEAPASQITPASHEKPPQKNALLLQTLLASQYFDTDQLNLGRILFSPPSGLHKYINPLKSAHFTVFHPPQYMPEINRCMLRCRQYSSWVNPRHTQSTPRRATVQGGGGCSPPISYQKISRFVWYGRSVDLTNTTDRMQSTPNCGAASKDERRGWMSRTYPSRPLFLGATLAPQLSLARLRG